MNARRHILLAVLAVTLTGLLGANAAREVSPAPGATQNENEFWLKTKLPEDLLAGRLNVTTMAKSSSTAPLPKRAPRKGARTAQLLR